MWAVPTSSNVSEIEYEIEGHLTHPQSQGGILGKDTIEIEIIMMHNKYQRQQRRVGVRGHWG